MKLVAIICVILILLIGTTYAGDTLTATFVDTNNKLYRFADDIVHKDQVYIQKDSAAIPIGSTDTGIEANNFVDSAAVTLDNTKVVFHTWADNLGDSTSGVKSYIKDINNGKLTLIKENARFPTISDDGIYVAYEYTPDYDNVLPALYLLNTQTNETTFIDYTTAGNEWGWKSQEFKIVNNTLYYERSYHGIGFVNKEYKINVSEVKP